MTVSPVTWGDHVVRPLRPKRGDESLIGVPGVEADTRQPIQIFPGPSVNVPVEVVSVVERKRDL